MHPYKLYLHPAITDLLALLLPFGRLGKYGPNLMSNEMSVGHALILPLVVPSLLRFSVVVQIIAL